MRFNGLRILLLILVAACGPAASDQDLPEADREQVLETIQEYAQGWEKMDSTAILLLFTDDAVITPSGRSPIEGIEAIREFWFPDDGSLTEVHSYDIEVLSSGGSGSFAYTTEEGLLSFTYSREDMSVSRTTRSFATTLYRKTADSDWRIFRRMWTDLRFGE